MAIAHRRLKVKVTSKVKVVGQADAVGPTSIEVSFFLVETVSSHYVLRLK